MPALKKIFNLVIVSILSFSLSGCSVVMAAKQTQYREVEIVKEGTSRARLIAEFGRPEHSGETPDGQRYDIFKFKQGYGKGNKALRMLFHATADLFTCFLWEIIGSPAEMLAEGEDVEFKAIYNDDEEVVSYEFY